MAWRCRECGPDVCDGDTSDDDCYHGDNVLNAIHPGEGARYRWDIDEDGTHHEGLDWYHPHIHGTTAIQVASGAAGAWIIRGPLDALPGVADARERILIFSTPPVGGSDAFEPLAEGEACTDATITFDDFETLGALSALQANMINGLRRPRMITAPGQVERWRILHAGFLDEVFLGLFRGEDGDCSSFSTASADTLRLVQIARDGLVMPQSFEHDYVFMSPGYRVEALLGGEGTLSDGDTYCLVAARFLQEHDTSRLGDFGSLQTSPVDPPSPVDVLARFQSDGDVVAILNVSAAAGAPTTTAMPDLGAIAALSPSTTLGGVPIEQRCAAAQAAPLSEVAQVAMLQVGVFTVDDPDPCGCAAYNVNCHNFEERDRGRYPFDRDLPLGALEHWRVGAAFDGHPFHIHINPYLVCPAPNVFDPIPFAHWRDTYLINGGRSIDVFTEYRAFTGPFVFHCHKLTHEDDGMMQLLRICDPSEDATCGDYTWRTCDPDDLDCAMARAATECAMEAKSAADMAACPAKLGGPAGVCGPNNCAGDGDCGPGATCVDFLCKPGGP